MTVSGNWVAVASADHVRQGREAGFMQVCHGKAPPLRRIHPGDRVAYYSPTVAFRGADRCRAFTSFGIVREGPPYEADLGGGFSPFRRDVEWLETNDAAIEPLLSRSVIEDGYYVCFSKTRVSMKQGGRTIIEKTGGHPTGNPAKPAVVLANIQRGTTGLKAGTFIVTGSFTGFHPVELNQPVTGEFEGFGTMEATIAG